MEICSQKAFSSTTEGQDAQLTRENPVDIKKGKAHSDASMGRHLFMLFSFWKNRVLVNFQIYFFTILVLV